MTKPALKREITVKGHRIGGDAPPVFLPDIGTFFNRDIELGLRLIDGVARAGAVFLKTEVLHDASICIETDVLETITTADGQVSHENYKQVIDRKIVPLSDYATLFAHARDRGLAIVVSVYDFAGLRFAVEQDAAMLKIGSSNIVHKPLIAATAKSGLPTIIDTGKSSLDEISRAVRWFLDAGGSALVIEHSPDAPPAPLDRHELGTIALLKQQFGCPVGLSDHHRGSEMLYAAIALGADIIEKGICPDDVTVEQDRAHALPIGALAQAIQGVANVAEACQGDIRDRGPSRLGNPARMGLMAARDIAAGGVVTEAGLTYAFPALGIPVEDIDRALGRRAARRIEAGSPIAWSDLQD